jgi:hypothetical protein
MGSLQTNLPGGVAGGGWLDLSLGWRVIIAKHGNHMDEMERPSNGRLADQELMALFSNPTTRFNLKKI